MVVAAYFFTDDWTIINLASFSQKNIQKIIAEQISKAIEATKRKAHELLLKGENTTNPLAKKILSATVPSKFMVYKLLPMMERQIP